MDRQTIIVDIAPGSGPVQGLKLSQGDIGRPMGVYIIQNGVALDCSAYSAELYILKPDGKFYTTQATVDATEMNLIKWDTAEQETPVAGACAAQIRITAGDDDIGTARFVEFVEASPCNLGSASESEVALLTKYVRQAHESATSAERDATTASGAASSASGSALTATAAANTATQAASAATAAADRAEAVKESIPADYTQLSDDVTGLKSALGTVPSGKTAQGQITNNANDIAELKSTTSAQGIYIETESKPIVSISDGAEDMPLKDLKVAIEPVQDLHGYDHPWPAGGGVNKFDGLWNGASSSFNYATNYIPVTAGESYFVVTPNVTTDYIYIDWCDAEKTVLSDKYVRNSTATAPAGASYARLRAWYTLDVTNISFNYPATDTAYHPYANICPITGWTGAKVTRTGKNVFGGEEFADIIMEKVPDAVIDTTNKTVTYAGSKIMGVIIFDKFKPNTRYSVFLRNTGMPNMVVRYSDGTSVGLISNGILVTDASKSVAHIRGAWNSGTTTAYYEDFGVFEGALTTDDFVPYTGNQFSVSFPSEAGTVYGGTLDVTTGELVVDRAEVDLGGIAWLYYTSGENPIFYGPLSDIKKILIAGVVPKMLTTIYKTVGTTARTNFASHANNCEITETLNGTTVFVRNDAFTDAVTFKAAMSGVKLVYELATPITYQLTPQEVRTLLGQNNIWADAGDVSLLYPADTKAYIDNQIASTRKLIAGIETEFKASKAYSAGDMLIIGNDLYKVSASIASGATITVGTNVTKTTVAEQLIALANA